VLALRKGSRVTPAPEQRATPRVSDARLADMMMNPTTRDDFERVARDLRDARAEIAEANALLVRQGSILHNTANALHGGPNPNGLWSWHNLAELAAAARKAEAEARAEAGGQPYRVTAMTPTRVHLQLAWNAHPSRGRIAAMELAFGGRGWGAYRYPR
jgi:regulator of protease activity HflC (stomatin/prohibitin superfamily)